MPFPSPRLRNFAQRGFFIFGQIDCLTTPTAASRAKVPLDKSKVITMHVTTSIEDKKLELQKALIGGIRVVVCLILFVAGVTQLTLPARKE